MSIKEDELEFYTDLAINECERWLEAITREKLACEDNLLLSLMCGHQLRKIANRLEPGSFCATEASFAPDFDCDFADPTNASSSCAAEDVCNWPKKFLRICLHAGLKPKQIFFPDDLDLPLQQRHTLLSSDTTAYSQSDARIRRVLTTIYEVACLLEQQTTIQCFEGPRLDRSALFPLVSFHYEFDQFSHDDAQRFQALISNAVTVPFEAYADESFSATSDDRNAQPTCQQQPLLATAPVITIDEANFSLFSLHRDHRDSSPAVDPSARDSTYGSLAGSLNFLERSGIDSSSPSLMVRPQSDVPDVTKHSPPMPEAAEYTSSVATSRVIMDSVTPVFNLKGVDPIVTEKVTKYLTDQADWASVDASDNNSECNFSHTSDLGCSQSTRSSSPEDSLNPASCRRTTNQNQANTKLTNQREEQIPTRTLKKSCSVGATNPLQFVAVKSCPLTLAAKHQLQLAEKSKEQQKQKPVIKDDDVDWQINLEKWKNKRKSSAGRCFGANSSDVAGATQNSCAENIAAHTSRKSSATSAFSELTRTTSAFSDSSGAEELLALRRRNVAQMTPRQYDLHQSQQRTMENSQLHLIKSTESGISSDSTDGDTAPMEQKSQDSAAELQRPESETMIDACNFEHDETPKTERRFYDSKQKESYNDVKASRLVAGASSNFESDNYSDFSNQHIPLTRVGAPSSKQNSIISAVVEPVEGTFYFKNSNSSAVKQKLLLFESLQETSLATTQRQNSEPKPPSEAAVTSTFYRKLSAEEQPNQKDAGDSKCDREQKSGMQTIGIQRKDAFELDTNSNGIFPRKASSAISLPNAYQDAAATSIKLCLKTHSGDRLGFGFTIKGGKDCPLEYSLPTVASVYPGSPADKGGLRIDDEILAINDEPVAEKYHAQINMLLKEALKIGEVEMDVLRKTSRALLSSLASTNGISSRTAVAPVSPRSETSSSLGSDIISFDEKRSVFLKSPEQDQYSQFRARKQQVPAVANSRNGHRSTSPRSSCNGGAKHRNQRMQSPSGISPGRIENFVPEIERRFRSPSPASAAADYRVSAMNAKRIPGRILDFVPESDRRLLASNNNDDDAGDSHAIENDDDVRRASTQNSAEESGRDSVVSPPPIRNYRLDRPITAISPTNWQPPTNLSTNPLTVHTRDDSSGDNSDLSLPSPASSMLTSSSVEVAKTQNMRRLDNSVPPSEKPPPPPMKSYEKNFVDRPKSLVTSETHRNGYANGGHDSVMQSSREFLDSPMVAVTVASYGTAVSSSGSIDHISNSELRQRNSIGNGEICFSKMPLPGDRSSASCLSVELSPVATPLPSIELASMTKHGQKQPRDNLAPAPVEVTKRSGSVSSCCSSSGTSCSSPVMRRQRENNNNAQVQEARRIREYSSPERRKMQYLEYEMQLATQQLPRLTVNATPPASMNQAAPKPRNFNAKDHWLMDEVNGYGKLSQQLRNESTNSSSATISNGSLQLPTISLPAMQKSNGIGNKTTANFSTTSQPSSGRSGEAYHNGSLHQMTSGSRNGGLHQRIPSDADSSTLSEEQVLSVRGDHKCAHCNKELGRGSAMAIEPLQAFYHLTCFRCFVCKTPLGDGAKGEDVRVRGKKLHCPTCYSIDEDGVQFSEV